MAVTLYTKGNNRQIPAGNGEYFPGPPERYCGTSADEKPIPAGINAVFFELDTGIFYYFDGTEWQIIPAGGGGIPTVTMTSAWGATTASAAVGEGTPVTATKLTGGKWVSMTEDSGIYKWVLFDFGEIPMDWVYEGGYNYPAGAWNDANRKYITGVSLYVPANETYGIPSAVLCLSALDATGNFVFSAYDAADDIYAEVVFSHVNESELTFVSAAMGTAPGATQDITALFPLLGAKMLFFCQGVEEIVNP